MIEKQSNSQDLNKDIQGWLQKLVKVQKSIKSEEIKNVLEKILNESEQQGSQDVIIKNISNTLKATTINLITDANDALDLILLISEYLEISQQHDLAPCLAAKFIWSIIKQKLPDTKALEAFAKSLSSTIIKKAPQAKNLTSLQSCCNLLKFFADLVKRFSQQLVGCVHIIKLLQADYNNNQDIQQIVNEIISYNVQQTNFVENFFKNEKDEEFFKLCTLLAKYDSDLDKEKFNIYLIKALSENQGIIQEQPKLYNQITTLIISSTHNLKTLIEGMLDDQNFLNGVICFDIILQILSFINEPNEIIYYFDFFQQLMLKIWNDQSTIETIQQVRISEVLNLLFDSHSKILSDVIKDETKILLNLEGAKHDGEFNGKFKRLQKEPTNKNMDKLIVSLSNAQIDQFSQEEMKTFLELIEISKSCDWIKHEVLIIQILRMIRDSRKIDKKMIILLKLETVVDQSMTIAEKKLLLEIIFSCMNDMDKFQGLSNLINKFLGELLDNFATRRVWFDLIEGSRENLSPQYMINAESMTLPENMKLVCQMENSSNYNRLESILKFSEQLTKEKLTKQDHDIIQKITDNFNSLIKNGK